MVNSQLSNTSHDRNLWNYFQSGKNCDKFSDAKCRLDIILKKIRKQNKSGKVLEIGLGDGYLTRQLFLLGYDVTGLDISDVNIKRLRKEMKNATLIIGNINNMPFRDESFDVIIATELIEHLNNKDLAKGLKEMKRCLRKGGMFIVTVPADEVLEDSMIFCPNCKFLFHRYGHRQSFSKARLESIFLNYFQNYKVTKFLEIGSNVNICEKIKYIIKMKLANLSYRYFSSFSGRFMIVGFK